MGYCKPQREIMHILESGVRGRDSELEKSFDDTALQARRVLRKEDDG
jgi:hypothetical protein